MQLQEPVAAVLANADGHAEMACVYAEMAANLPGIDGRKITTLVKGLALEASSGLVRPAFAPAGFFRHC